MSNIDKQDNQVSRYDLVSGYMQKWPDGEFVYHSDYQALLDELEAKDKSISFLKDQLAQLANFNPDWDKLEAATGSLREHMAELTAARKRIAELEAREVTLPPLNDDLIAILGRPNFTCSHLAELMRKSGDEIRRKSEHEQAAVIHWFLGLYLDHGDKWEGVAKANIQSRVAAAGRINGEG